MNRFQTKKAIKEYLSNILHSNLIGRVTDDTTNEILFELVNHSQQSKLNDFSHFEVDRDKFRSKCFYVCDKNNIKTDFSYNWIIRSYTPLSKQKRQPDHIACMITCSRGSINDQIIKWRKINNIDSTFKDVDHYPVPFIKILYDWYDQQEDLEIPAFQQKNQMWRFAKSHEKSWREYHQKNAQYRALDKIKNSQNSSYGYIPDWDGAINRKNIKKLQ